MTESNDKLLGSIGADVKTLLKRTEAFEYKLDKLDDKKADVKVVEQIRDELHEHLSGVDEIIAFAVRPVNDQVKDNTERIDSVEKKMLKFGGILIGVGSALQILWLIFQDSIKNFFL